MFSALPSTLLALLFALPAFSEPTSEPISSNDPFRAISLQVAQQPTEPICCLKPSTPSGPVDDGILLSFEEWKMRQLAAHTHSGHSHEAYTSGSTGVGWDGDAGAANRNNSESVILPSDDATPTGSASADQPTPEWAEFSYSKVPTTDRFNYASLDCSARVHTAHRSAKSPSSILSSKRDRYMLSPCNASKESQFVVVELCDDIRIDTVQLANFEFFSGVFKDFTVSVAKTHTLDPDAWTLVRSYRAKNVRGVQTFHPPTTLRDFYRFIRIDFQSHYGNEYYCPVSLLRVYGLTHLEEWKLEIWEAESRAKQLEMQKRRQVPSPTDIALPALPSNTAHSTRNSIEVPTTSSQWTDNTATNFTSPDPTNSGYQDKQSSSSGTTSESLSTSSNTHFSSVVPSSNDIPTSSSAAIGQELTTPATRQFSHSTNSFTPPPHISTSIPPPNPQAKDSELTTFVNTQTAAVNTTTTRTVHSTPSHSQYTPDTPTIVVASPSADVIPVQPIAKGGESIYRTILNRLTEVEVNQTLYMRYIEQQNMAIGEVIRRLAEDVGRLEGITRAQSLTYQRTLNDWEKQRYQLEMEYGDLLSRIELLSEEIILEKRLGVAQLCLLLAVLVFLGLTRGSRAEALIDHGSTQLNRSVREWGKRHFKISSDWTGRFKGKNLEIGPTRQSTPTQSREPSRTRAPAVLSRPNPISAKTYPPPLTLRSRNDENMVAFPSSSRTPLETINTNTSAAAGDYFDRPRTRTISNPRSRAPSIRTPGGRRTPHFQKVTTPMSANFRARSNSHGVPSIPLGGSWRSMNVPKSAKKWARTAHLHEIKTFGRPASAGVRRSTDLDLSTARHPSEFQFEPKRAGDENFSLPPLSTSAKPPSGDFPRSTSSPSLTADLFLKSEPSVDDGDGWADTDSLDGSELDAEQVLGGHSPRDTKPASPIL